MRVKKVPKSLLAMCREPVISAVVLVEGARPCLSVQVRLRARRHGRCWRCGELGSFYDQRGGARRWRHIDVG